jgi:hypothetical protein
MKKRYYSVIMFFAVIAIFSSCTGVDIDDEQAVIKDMQGTWTGYECVGSMYRYVKLTISENSFEGWLQTSETNDEPSWTVLPNERGTLSLSSVLDYANNGGKYRKIGLSIPGRCCGDKSLAAVTLSKLITYDDGRGLIVAGRASMIKKRPN